MSRYKLTDQQRDAVECPQLPTLVIAGLGTGKTFVMANRFVYLLENHKLNLKRILCVTFTNKAVKNLKEKILGCAPLEVLHRQNEIQVMTFHALCKQILLDIHKKRMHNFDKKCMNMSKLIPLIKEILKDFPHIKASWSVSEILGRLRWIRNGEDRDFTQNDLIEVGMKVRGVFVPEKIIEQFPMNDIREIYKRFDEALQERGLMTIDDIILEAKKYLMEQGLVDEWSSRFDAILCDEFQDVDLVQFEILTKLCSDDHNLFCVGDQDQAIYGFRGAIPKVFSKMKEHFESLQVPLQIKRLERNFRSTPEILVLANKLMDGKRENSEFSKTLFTDKYRGSIPTLDVATSQPHQAKLVVQRVKELEAQGVPRSKIIVLGRNRSHYRYIRNELMVSDINYDDWSEVYSLMKHAEIKDLVYWLNVGFEQNLAEWGRFFERVYCRPACGVGPTTFSRLKEYGYANIFYRLFELKDCSLDMQNLLKRVNEVRNKAEETDIPFAEKCKEMANISRIFSYHSDSQIRIDNMTAFLNSPMIINANSWKDVMDRISKYLYDKNEERVICSTIHGVKGLEFDHVFLVSLSEGNLPSSVGMRLCTTEEKRKEYLDEERRIMYVACTRAKKTLHLFSDKTEISPFVSDVSDTLKSRIYSDNSVVYSEYLDSEESEEDNLLFDEI